MPYFERPHHLKISLEGFNQLYVGRPIEILVIDDGSAPEFAPKIPNDFNLPIKIVRVLNDVGINPCTQYNLGARLAKGRTLILSSPEVIHSHSIFDLAPNISQIKYDEYYVFSVFGLWRGGLNNKFLKDPTYSNYRKIFNEFSFEFNTDPNSNENDLFDSPGNWYAHGKFNPSGLNFLSAINRNLFFDLSGFDERFRNGSGFDDYEFRRRLRKRAQIRYLDEMRAIHLEHEIVSERQDIGLGINSNERLYRFSKFWRYKSNDNWGRIEHKVEIELNY